MNLQHDRIAALCEQLKLDRLPAEWPAVAQTTIDSNGTHADFLEAALQLQHDGLNERRRQTIAKRHYFDNSQLCFFAAYQGIGCNHF